MFLLKPNISLRRIWACAWRSREHRGLSRVGLGVDGWRGSILPLRFWSILYLYLLVRWLSSTSIQSQRSVSSIAPWKPIVSQWGDPVPRLLPLLINALQQQPHLQPQLVARYNHCLCYCWIKKSLKICIIFYMIISRGVNCPDGWTVAGRSCYYLSTEIKSHFTDAAQFCENLGSTLVEVSQVNHDCFW